MFVPSPVRGILHLPQNHPLIHQLLKRLQRTHVSSIEEHLVPEPAVKQVQHRVLRASDVEVHGHPVALFLGVPGSFRVLRIDISQVVPARPGPLRHRVGFALVFVGIAHPRHRLAEWRLGPAGGAEVVQLGEPHWQFRQRHGVRSIILIEQDRERLAPVALAREEPVAQFVINGLLAEPLGFQPRRNPGLGVGGGKAVERQFGIRGIDADARLRLGGLKRRARSFNRFRHDTHDREPERFREGEVALVVARDGHDRAGAVTHQHVVGDSNT